MRSENDTNEALVSVDRKMLYAPFVVAWWGVWATAGLVIAFAQRAGASTVVANTMGFSIAALLMYPYFAIRLKTKAAPVPTFRRWAVHWIAASAIGTFVASLLVDTLWR